MGLLIFLWFLKIVRGEVNGRVVAQIAPKISEPDTNFNRWKGTKESIFFSNERWFAPHPGKSMIFIKKPNQIEFSYWPDLLSSRASTDLSSSTERATPPNSSSTTTLKTPHSWGHQVSGRRCGTSRGFQSAKEGRRVPRVTLVRKKAGPLRSSSLWRQSTERDPTWN